MAKIIRKWPKDVNPNTKKYRLLQDLFVGISSKDGVEKYGKSFQSHFQALTDFHGYDIRAFKMKGIHEYTMYKIVGRMSDDGYEDYIKMEEVA